MKKLFKNYLFVLVLLTSNIITAQTVVLVNGVPTRVQIQENYLTDISKEAPNYMAGFETAPYEGFKKVRPRLGPPISEPMADADVVRKEKPAKLDNFIGFKNNSVKLSGQALSVLKKYADKFKQGNVESVLLQASHKNNKKGEELAKKRLEACKKIFEQNGIRSNLILTSMTTSNDKNGGVSIVLK